MQTADGFRSVVARQSVALSALITAALAVVVLAIAILIQMPVNAAHQHRADQAAADAREVASSGVGVLLNVVDAQSGQRGYLLTGRAEYLNTVRQATERAAAAVARLHGVAAADKDYASQAAQIRKVVDRRLQNIERTLELAQAGRRDESLAILNTEGRAAMIDLRRDLGTLIVQTAARESALRAEYERLERRSRAMQTALAAVTVLALMIGMLSLFLERRTARRAASIQARMTDEILLARGRAEEANQAKSRFLATASHDMRQPLHAMALYISTLERRVESEQAKEILGNMDGAVRSMTRLFTALLDLARLEAGVLKPEPAEFPLGDLLRDVADQSVDPGSRGAVRVRVVATRLHVHSDPDLLEIVLRNLTSNAVKHSKGGEVLLGCRRIGDQVRIEVHDTGPGIPPEHIDRLFSEFVRGDQAGSAEGVGLGLSIVERMAKLLGHKLSVKSDVGRGSVFAITVPCAAAAARPACQVAPVALEGVRVLIADDEPLALDAMRRAFEDVGARVTTADTADAVRTLPPQAFDLYVFDLNLGRENGLGLLTELEQRDGTGLAALIVTGATTPEVLASLRDGGRAWVTKPISAANLTRTAAVLLRGSASSAP